MKNLLISKLCASLSTAVLVIAVAAGTSHAQAQSQRRARLSSGDMVTGTFCGRSGSVAKRSTSSAKNRGPRRRFSALPSTLHLLVWNSQL